MPGHRPRIYLVACLGKSVDIFGYDLASRRSADERQLIRNGRGTLTCPSRGQRAELCTACPNIRLAELDGVGGFGCGGDGG